MTTDDALLIGSNPPDHRLLNLSLLPGMAHAVRDAGNIQKLQALPDIPDHEPAHDIETVTLEIGLMPVNHKDALPGFGMSQDQSLLSDHPLLLYVVAPVFLDVVIAYDEVEPILLVKPMQQVKDASMSIPNVAEPPVLPQLVAISDFKIGKTCPEIMSQCVEEHSFIPGKGIGPAIISPVAIAEKDNPTRIIIENFLSGLKDLRQSPVCQTAPNIVGDSRILLG